MKISNNRAKLIGTAVVLSVGAYLATTGALSQQAPPPTLNRFAGPTNSQPIALDANGTLLASVNPDNNSVTFFDVTRDTNKRLREIPVGAEPNGVVINPQGTRAYVANTVSGTISVLNINRSAPQIARVAQEIRVGTEPYGVALTPNGTKLYVTNRRSNNVSVIDTRTNRIIKTIDGVGPAPTGIAITNNGDDADDDETIFVTQFFALPRPGRLDGEDDSKQGLVTVIRSVSDEVDSIVNLLPIGDTGFKAAGDAIAKVAPPNAVVADADKRFTTSAYTNQLNNIVIKGNFAYVPSTGASPNGPTLFDVNTQSLLGVIDLTKKADANQTINMHVAVRNQTATPKLFLTQPWAAAAKRTEDEIYVLSAASDVLVKAIVDRGTGLATVQNAPGVTPTRVLQIATGKNPRGVVINNTDTRAYVMNYISRDVTVVNIERGQDRTLPTMASASLPTPGSTDDLILAGKELYNSSVGEFDGNTPLSPKIRGRMSNNGWGSCAACHPDGLTDNVVWMFGSGPRRTIPQHQDFDPDDPSSIRALNWSGIFDEVEDFELNIRNVSGGQGILVGDDGTTPLIPVTAFTPANANRRQLRIRGFPAWDAIKAYVQFGIRTPISPIDKNDPDVIAGEQLFIQANCQSCHGGAQWSTSRVNFTPPPAADVLSNTQIIGELKKVGTFDGTQKNETRIGAVNGVPAVVAPLGTDGFVPPTLMGLHAFPQTYFHNGSANTLDDVMNAVAHRASGTNGVDTLTDPNQRAQIIKYILSIDAFSTPIPPQ